MPGKSKRSSLPPVYRICIVGSGGVGKSSLTIFYLRNCVAVDEYDPTVEDIYHKQVRIKDQTLHLEIVDTAGQDDYQVLADEWYRGGEAFVVTYSITDERTFSEVMNITTKIRKVKDAQSWDEIPMVLVGNKSDLEEQREVPFSEGKALSKTLNCPFLETSAKNGENVTESWEEAVLELLALEEAKEKNSTKPLKRKRRRSGSSGKNKKEKRYSSEPQEKKKKGFFARLIALFKRG